MATDVATDVATAVVTAPREHRSRGAARWLGQVAAWLVVLGVSAVLLVAVGVPRVAGATPYTVLTGSMRPAYPPGTLIVVKPVAPADVRIGQVITFQLESGQGAVVSHRVIGTRTGQDGELEFLVKGDANAAPDAEAVRAVQLRGRLWYAVPHLGRVNNLLTGDQRQYAVYAASLLLVGYALTMFARSARQRRSRDGDAA